MLTSAPVNTGGDTNSEGEPMSRRTALLISSGLCAFVLVIGISVITTVQAGRAGGSIAYQAEAYTPRRSEVSGQWTAGAGQVGAGSAESSSRTAEGQTQLGLYEDASARPQERELRRDRRSHDGQRTLTGSRAGRDDDDD